MPRFSSCLLKAALIAALALVLVAQRLDPPPVLSPVASPPLSLQTPQVADPQQQSTASPTDATTPQSAILAAPGPAQPILPQKQVNRRPQVAIIIDDMGYNLDIGRQLLQLDLPLSFSFLPAAPHTPALAQQAQARGHSILVHLPMEPKEWRGNEESQTLRLGESEEEIQRKLEGMLAAVPVAIGANNHMGSRFTEDRRGIRQVLVRLRAGSLFFIDSFTSPASVGETTAQQLGLPTARRRVFLDNEQHSGAICRQLGLLAAKATAEGEAIAIGHPNLAMVEALSTCAGERLGNVQLVGAERLVR